MSFVTVYQLSELLVIVAYTVSGNSEIVSQVVRLKITENAFYFGKVMESCEL